MKTEKLPSFFICGNNQFAYKARSITNITGDLISNPTNTAIPKVVLIVLSVLCTIVMLSACLNYTNLSIARLLTRAKEVGVRKVSGASRKQIFAQFIIEAVVVALVSFVHSLLILVLLQQLFSGLWLNTIFNISFTHSPKLYLVFIGFSILVGIIAGLLPSIYVSFLTRILLQFLLVRLCLQLAARIVRWCTKARTLRIV